MAGGEGAGVWEKGQSLGWTQCSSDIVLLVELKPTNKNLEEDLRQSRCWRMKWRAMLTARPVGSVGILQGVRGESIIDQRLEESQRLRSSLP